MLRSLTLAALLLCGACRSPDSTLIVQSLAQLETNYAARAKASDVAVANSPGVAAEARAEYQAAATKLDADTAGIFDRIKRIVTGWGSVDWKDVYEHVEGLLKRERGQ